MALENTTFKHGASVYPVPAATTNEALLDVDPARYYLLAFYASVIQTYIGSRLLAEATLVGATGITAAVAYTLPTDPQRYLTEAQAKFPLLAVWRESGIRRDRTLTWRHDAGTWKVAYVLPPLTAGQYERLEPMLRGVANIIENRTETTYDPAFMSGAKIMGSAYSNIETAYVMSEEYGSWANGGELEFPSVTLTLEVRERGAPIATAYEAMTDITTSLDNTATGEATLADVVQLDTDTA